MLPRFHTILLRCFSLCTGGIAPAFACGVLLLASCAGPDYSSAQRRFSGSAPPETMDAAAARASTRPGLGTGWGEERDSRVSATSFTRTSTSRPAGTERLYYNDRRGIDAMLDHVGGPHHPSDGLAQIPGGLLSVGLKNSAGRWLDGFVSKGRRLVVGRQGDRYEIVLRNETDARLEVVVSVDGLDVLDGRGASFSKRGYIIGAGQTFTVEGFRRSSRQVAAFRFSSVDSSYAALRHGDTRNVGVIGIAAFTERGLEPTMRDRRDARNRWRADPFPGHRWAEPPP